MAVPFAANNCSAQCGQLTSKRITFSEYTFAKFVILFDGTLTRLSGGHASNLIGGGGTSKFADILIALQIPESER
jgi:hypothetical protein